MFKVKIIIPSQVIEPDLEVKDVLIPTRLGQTGILDYHSNMIMILDVGILIVTGNNYQKKYFIDEGVCKVVENVVTILSSTCEQKSEININDTKTELQELQKLLDQINMDHFDYQNLYKRYLKAKFRLEVATS